MVAWLLDYRFYPFLDTYWVPCGYPGIKVNDFFMLIALLFVALSTTGILITLYDYAKREWHGRKREGK
jgi:hypothetical protein